jgi:triacylglycerol esterase/lipase EstA (alpha/beta hydrolase family)
MMAIPVNRFSVTFADGYAHNFMHIETITHRSKAYFLAFELLCCFILSACASTPQDQTHSPLSNAHRLPNPDLIIDIPSLSNCSQSDDSSLHLNSQKPVTVIIHGCFSSAGRFHSLADVFAFHGQQAICFNYNDRDRLRDSSAELITAIEKLSKHLHQPEVTVIGHSQGGLVARRALIGERPDRLEADETHMSTCNRQQIS